MSQHKCEVCNDEDAIGVACVPGMPMSVSYGPRCLEQDAHPAWALRLQVSMCGGIGGIHPTYLEMAVHTPEGYITLREELEQRPLTKEELEGPPPEDIEEVLA